MASLLVANTAAANPAHGISVNALISSGEMTVASLLNRAMNRETYPQALPKTAKQEIVAQAKPTPAKEAPIVVKASEAKKAKTAHGEDVARVVIGDGCPAGGCVERPDNAALAREAAAIAQKVKEELAKPLPGAPSNDQLEFEVKVSGDNVRFNPTRIVFDSVGSSANVTISVEGAATASDELSLFVRDASVITWNARDRKIVAQAEGETEIYSVINGKMYIIPVSVAPAAQDADLTIPDPLLSLNNVLDATALKTKEARFAGSVDAAAKGPRADSSSDRLSLADSVAEAEKTLAEERRASQHYVLENRKLRYKSVSLQVVDERSIPAAKMIYPVAGAKLRVLGTEFVAKTNATGHVTLDDVPVGGRLLVSVDDDRGLIKPSLLEVQVANDTDEEVILVKTLTTRSFELYAQVFGNAQDARLGSFCGRLTTAEGSTEGLSGLKVGLNAEAEGTLYFNDFGPDPLRTTTGQGGRFCFFNVSPGLTELTVYEDETPVSSTVVSLFPGKHVESDIVLGNGPAIKTRLASMASAYEQVYGDAVQASRLTTVDSVDLSLVGENTVMNYWEEGLMGVEAGATFQGERAYGLVQGAEFEPTLYTYSANDAARGDVVTPLIQRGFVEDVFNELYMADGSSSIAYDPALGSAVIFHGHMAGQGSNAVNIRLVDSWGRNVDGGWYFGVDGSGMAKAIFFNLQPGIYSVIVETENNYWVDTTTIAVDNWTVSFAQTGNKLLYK